MRKFIKLLARYIPDEIVTYPEYRGEPYYSILYEEDGQQIVGYSSYKLDVISAYLIEFFFNQEE